MPMLGIQAGGSGAGSLGPGWALNGDECGVALIRLYFTQGELFGGCLDGSNRGLQGILPDYSSCMDGHPRSFSISTL